MKRLAAIAAALLTLAACGGNPQQLPVAVSNCRAVRAEQGFNVFATIENRASKPISELEMAISFYRDFRYQKFSGSARPAQELDPGAKRVLNFRVRGAEHVPMEGPAMGCFVTHAGYLDGTSQDAVPPQ